jgi:hypothetical protein
VSSSASEVTTTTEERTKVSVETEEVTLYQCPVCDQQVGEDELVPVDIADGERQTVSCEYCANSLFGFEGDATNHGITQSIGEAASSLTDLVSAGAVRALISLSIGLTVCGLVFQQIMTEVQTSTIEEVGTAPPIAIFDILPILLIGIIIWMGLRMMVIGPRP